MIEIVSSIGADHSNTIGEKVPFICKIASDDGRAFATGGLAFWRGTYILFFQVDDPPKNIIRQTLRECKALLSKAVQLGATEVFTPRDPEYPSSERLCRLAGFEKTDEMIDGKEIWRWQHLE